MEEGGEGVGSGREGGVVKLEGVAVWEGRGREGGVVKLLRVEGVRDARPLERSEAPVSVSALMLFISSSSLNSASFSCIFRSTLGSETAGDDSPPLFGEEEVALIGE